MTTRNIVKFLLDLADSFLSLSKCDDGAGSKYLCVSLAFIVWSTAYKIMMDGKR